MRQHKFPCSLVRFRCGVKGMLFFHWFYKGKMCSSPPRFMRRQAFAWWTMGSGRDFNDFQGFCSRIRWRPKSAISFPHRLLCPESLFFQGFSTVSGKPSGSLFFWQAPFAQKACFITVLATRSESDQNRPERSKSFVILVFRWEEEDLEKTISLPLERLAPSGIESEPR